MVEIYPATNMAIAVSELDQMQMQIQITRSSLVLSHSALEQVFQSVNHTVTQVDQWENLPISKKRPEINESGQEKL